MNRSLIVGAGSIGQRHAEVLAGLGHEVAFVSARTDLEHPVFTTVDEAVRSFRADYAVVATPTAVHAGSVGALTGAGFAGRLLVEKPLAVGASELVPFERVGVGFNLRFHPVVRRMRELLSATTVHTVEAYVGQHLAQWRPGRATAEQYSASRAAGGGALRDLSHELDYLVWCLGAVRGVFALGGRVAEVTVDSDDAWAVVAEHDGAPVVSLQLNYLDTRARRRVTATTTAGTIAADVVAGVLEGDGVAERFDVERNTSYAAMHAAMLSDGVDVCTVDEALRTEQVIGMIEESARTRKWVAA